MVKKIRNSLSAKVFLWIAGLLILCSLLIYGMVMIFLPQSYTVVASSRVERKSSSLLTHSHKPIMTMPGMLSNNFARAIGHP